MSYSFNQRKKFKRRLKRIYGPNKWVIRFIVLTKHPELIAHFMQLTRKTKRYDQQQEAV